MSYNKKNRVAQQQNIIKPMSMSSSKANSLRYEGLYDQLCIMLNQESSKAYTTHDYLSHIHVGTSPSSNNEVTFAPLPVDQECRIKMTQWCFQVVDYVKYKRSTVSIALSLLDRFLSVHETSARANEALHCRKVYQLASMTTLFMAMKLNDRSEINGNIFCELSRNVYDVKDILSMEMTILETLQWRINAPLAIDFISYFLCLVPCLQRQQKLQKLQKEQNQRRKIFSPDLDDKESSFADILDLCGYQIDLGVGQYSLVTSKQSTIAIAALLNAFDSNITADMVFSMDDGNRLNHFEFTNILLEELTAVTNINVYSEEIQATKNQLLHLLKSNDDRGNMKNKNNEKKRTNNDVSSSSSTSTNTHNVAPVKSSQNSNRRQTSPKSVSSRRVLRRNSHSCSSSTSARNVMESTRKSFSFLDRTSSFLQQRLTKSFAQK